MNFAKCLGTTDQFAPVTEVGRKCFLDSFIVEDVQNRVHDLAYALGVEFAKLAIHGHTTADMNRSKRWIRKVLFVLFGMWFVFRCLVCGYEDLQFVAWSL